MTVLGLAAEHVGTLRHVGVVDHRGVGVDWLEGFEGLDGGEHITGVAWRWRPDAGNQEREEGSDTRVLWSDLRYCRPGVFPADTPGRIQIACDLWFGGRFSAGGNPLIEIVQVGGWLQTRPVGQ